MRVFWGIQSGVVCGQDCPRYSDDGLVVEMVDLGFQCGVSLALETSVVCVSYASE